MNHNFLDTYVVVIDTHTSSVGLYENTIAPVGPFLGPFNYLPACVDTHSWL